MLARDGSAAVTSTIPSPLTTPTCQAARPSNIGFLGLVEDDLYTVGVLILFIGGVGLAVLAGEYLIRYFGSRQPPV